MTRTMNIIGRRLPARLAIVLALGMTNAAFAQTVAPQPGGSPMVKPPPAATPDAASATNPDNMPVKKPTTPTNDKMSHGVPASGTNAK